MSPLGGDLRKAARYALALRGFWHAPVTLTNAAHLVRARVAERNQTFLRFVQASIFAHPGSPYLPLLQAAHIGANDVIALTAAHGVEGALQRLYEAGVYITLDEFKGNKPLQRGAVQLDVSASDFDNPISAGHFSSATGGTRSTGTRLLIDLADLLDEVYPRALFLAANEQLGHPFAMWMPAPPSLASLRITLLNTKAGMNMVRWFSQTRPGLNPISGKSAFLTWSTVLMSRLSGKRVPLPRYVPIDHLDKVLAFLAQGTARGDRVHFCTNVSSAVRLVKVAQEMGLDISGHTMRTGSEPLTEAKAALLRDAGLGVMSAYGMLESGTLGLSCGNPAAADDMHLLSYRMAITPAERHFPGLSVPIQAILLSVFAPRGPKVMLNVENGDYGVLTERLCGCALEVGGLHQHLHTIRSYEKLSSAGMSFLGSDLLEIIDVALPARFGGGPTDYQFVESEIDSETVVRLLVRPELGLLNETEVAEFVLSELRQRSLAGRMQTQIWRDSHMLRIERAQPYLTGTAKIQALHVEKRRP